jgi:L-fuconate dehydratase
MDSDWIRTVTARDLRFPLEEGAGSDAVHSGAEYAYAVTELTGERIAGTGIALTLGRGNELVCDAIALLGESLAGRDIEPLMADFGRTLRLLADHPQLRWLGPHKGVTHLALASLTNACFDFWAKARGVPLWQLLLSLSADEIARLLDLSYVEDIVDGGEARALIERERESRPARASVLKKGYPGYDPSVGWFQFEDRKVVDFDLRAREKGFKAVKLKVGSEDAERDLRRANLLREALGPDTLIMLDANQQWSLPKSISMGRALAAISPYWLEEPTHPDDVFAHQRIAREISPVRVALGEHVPNRVLFKAFMQAQALSFVQADCTRLAGVSEFLTVSLMARKFNLPVVPHVGDMGQIHQHLVLFNHIGLGHERLFLEYIPHLADRFVQPAVIRDGVYATPDRPGGSCDLKI